jgi:glutathione S-transferase
LRPEPPLIGRDPLGRALVLQWNARIEQDGFQAAAEAFRNRVPGLAGRAVTGVDGYDQIPALAERGRQRTANFLADLDRHLADSSFVVGDEFSMADITALVVVDFAARAVAPPDGGLENLARWYRVVSSRPSASA